MPQAANEHISTSMSIETPDMATISIKTQRLRAPSAVGDVGRPSDWTS